MGDGGVAFVEAFRTELAAPSPCIPPTRSRLLGSGATASMRRPVDGYTRLAHRPTTTQASGSPGTRPGSGDQGHRRPAARASRPATRPAPTPRSSRTRGASGPPLDPTGRHRADPAGADRDGTVQEAWREPFAVKRASSSRRTSSVSTSAEESPLRRFRNPQFRLVDSRPSVSVATTGDRPSFSPSAGSCLRVC